MLKQADGRTIQWPCNKPPWGRLIAVKANTGDIAWAVPLGITGELGRDRERTGRGVEVFSRPMSTAISMWPSSPDLGCTSSGYHSGMRASLLFVAASFVATAGLFAQERPSSCAECPAWNMPQKPFKIYGNTYYVGTHGLGSILIASTAGHVLIDGALPESVPQIVANIKALGFRIEDVKLIVNSHVHFDHAGGIAELQKLSGARVAASKWTADVMKKGAVPRDDPQFGVIMPIAPISQVQTFKDRETLSAGAVTVTAHLTPGHTPGGTSWTWRSCESSRCLNMVYADSLTPVSADNFQFTKSKEYPNALDDFEKSYSFLDTTPCDILITPHPDFSRLWERLEQRSSKPDAMVDSTACRQLTDSSRERLKKRLATERGR